MLLSIYGSDFAMRDEKKGRFKPKKFSPRKIDENT
jgi:hypothetical protein